MSLRAPPGLTAWILCCAASAFAGWALSIAGALNVWGYVVALGACVLVWAVAGGKKRWRRIPQIHLPRWRWRRLRRPLAAVYFALAALIILGGALNAPNNYDALTYRLPRLLHWMAADGWHWIVTPNDRMNIGAAVTEWVNLPLVLLSRSDRLLFLVNSLSFLLLPGLIYSVARLAGVHRLVAWRWMWLLPTGYGFVLQAGGIGTDLPGAVFALAAVQFGLLAARTSRVEFLWVAGIAVALLTGAKTTNLPLLLPILIAAWPALPLLRLRPVVTAGVLVVMLVVSFVPTAFLNQRHTGHWSGDPRNESQVRLSSPSAGFLGNSLQLVAQSFAPPLLPGARKIESAIYEHLPAAMLRELKTEFPRFRLGLGELPQEESSGLGIGVATMIALAFGAAVVGAIRRGGRGARDWLRRPAVWIGFGTWFALAFYMIKMGSDNTARLTLAYQPLALLPLLACGGQPRLHRRRWWNRLAVLAAASALIGVVLTPSRPLVPVQRLIGWIDSFGIAPEQLARAKLVYETYSRRNDLLEPLRRHLPADVERVGFLAGADDTEYSLWRPFGRRRVIHLWDGRALAMKPEAFPEWNVIKAEAWQRLNPGDISAWADRRDGVLVARESIISKVSAGREEWWVVRLRRPGGR